MKNSQVLSVDLDTDTSAAKSSRELRCSLRQQLFSGYQRAPVQHQVFARQSQVHRSPRSRVDGVGLAAEKNSSHLPDILHHTQRISRFANREPQPCGRPFPSHTTSLRYSDSDYELRGNPYARSGLPNSSRLSPVHVWWLSHVTRLRVTTGAPCQLPKSTNWN